MKKLRISYTALSIWKSRDTQRLVEYFDRVRRPMTDQMKEGIRLDDEACEMVVKTGKLPDHFGGFELIKPEPQLKLEVEFPKRKIIYEGDGLEFDSVLLTGKEVEIQPFTLVGVLDTYDHADGTIYEYKTGVSSSLDYSRTMQVPLYALMCKLKGLEYKLGKVCAYNQYEKTSGVHAMLLTNDLIRSTLKKLLVSVYEIQTTLESHKNIEWTTKKKD